MRVFVVVLLLATALISVPVASATPDELIDFQALIDDAAPGSVIVLESGRYAGGVTIDKPLTVLGRDWPIIDSEGRGTVIKVTAPDVTIEGLIIRGSGASLDREDTGIAVDAPRVTIRGNRLEEVLFGIFLRKASNSVIAGNIVGAKEVFIANRGDGIRLWESEQTLVEGNLVIGGRDTVFWFSEDIIVRGNEITGGRYGLHFMYSDDAVIENNILSRNSVGAFMMYSSGVILRGNIMAENFGPSGYGLGLKDMDQVTIEGNRFIGNRVGMYLDNSPYDHNDYQYVTGNLFAYNKTGVLMQPAVKRNVFSRNAFIENAAHVGIASSGKFSGNEWSIDGVGNYWSDFAGYDAGGDGIGDVSYRVDDLYNTLIDAHPHLRFFQDTPAAKMIALAAEMFPIFRPLPLVEDDFPLINRPPMKSVHGGDGGSLNVALLLISTLMIAGAGMAVLIPSRRRRSYPNKEAIT